VGVSGERPDWIAVIKRGLELRGRKVGPVRPPMLPLTDEVDARLQQALAAMRLPAPGDS
jgi:dihydrodipicolinate synthase/N-acetylneuraminate lyase